MISDIFSTNYESAFNPEKYSHHNGTANIFWYPRANHLLILAWTPYGIYYVCIINPLKGRV